MSRIIENVPEILLKNILDKSIKVRIQTNEDGVVCGIEELIERAKEIGLGIVCEVSSGDQVKRGRTIALLNGNPLQVVAGEDSLLSAISKVSGVATAAREAVQKAGKLKVVCGGWKKVPRENKHMLRKAVEIGGAETRLVSVPFIYLDKNYVRIYGSVEAALKAAESFPDRAIAIQLKGEAMAIEDEALAAAKHGADVLMVDTGLLSDARKCSEIINQNGLRQKVKLAFSGGLRIEDLADLKNEDIDIVDIGRAILDAPLLDFKYDVYK